MRLGDSKMAEEAEGGSDDGLSGEEEDGGLESARGEKRGRGRPPQKRIDTGSQEALRMKKYLEKGKAATFEVTFGKGDSLMHSPMRTRAGTVGKTGGNPTERTSENGTRKHGTKAAEAEVPAETSEIVAVVQEKERENEKNSATPETSAETAGIDGEKKTAAESERWCEWMCERIGTLESKIVEVSEENRKLAGEVRELRVRGEADMIKMGSIKNELQGLKIRAERSETRIKEFEIVLGKEGGERENRRERDERQIADASVGLRRAVRKVRTEGGGRVGEQRAAVRKERRA